MSRTVPTHSVPQGGHGVKGGYPWDANNLVSSILSDSELRRSALGIAVLAALIGYGAANNGMIPAPIGKVADDLGTTYDSVYKRLRWLAGRGYVQLSRVAQQKQERLFLRLVWPQTKPVARKPRSTKQG